MEVKSENIEKSGSTNENKEETAQKIRNQQAQELAKQLEQLEEQALELTPEQEKQALNELGDVIRGDTEFAQNAVAGSYEFLEEIIQDHVHEKFTISKNNHDRGLKRLTPMVQKYAPSALVIFGKWKGEMVACYCIGSLIYGSCKQLNEIKAIDAKKAAHERKEGAPHATS